MSTALTQLFRLEVERDPDDGQLINLVPNPSGELGAWGWVTPVPSSTLRSTRLSGAFHLVYISPGSVPSYFFTEPMPVAPGQYAAARLLAPTVAGLYALKFEWLDVTGTFISATTASTTYGSSSDVRVYAPFDDAPSGAAYVRLRVDHYNGSGGNPGALTTIAFRDAIVTVADDADLITWTRTNLLPTPTGDGGPGGWGSGNGTVGTSSSVTLGGRDSIKLTKTPGDGETAALTSAAMTVTPGRDYALQVRSHPDAQRRVVTVSARWFKAGGDEISVVDLQTATEPSGDWTPVLGGVVTAPTNAATLRMRVQYRKLADGEVHYINAAMVEHFAAVRDWFDGNNTDTAAIDYAWSGTPYASPSTASGEIGDPGEIVPVPYQNILGPASQITADREDLNVGSLSVKLFDAVLDPTQSDLIQTGRRIRLVTIGDTGPDQVIFAGKIFTGAVTYHLLEPNEQKRAEVNLTAVDPISALANAPRREGVATIAELPYVLEGAGVPWSCNGDGGQLSSATVVAYNDNASTLDQVAVTRDSALGYAWVDRNGVLQAWDRDELDTTVAAVLDESTYNTDFDVSFDMDRVINSVTVKVLRVIATTGATEEVSFGPYVDLESYRAHGEHAQEFVVQGFDTTDTATIQAYAEQILEANATPRMRVNSLTVPIREADDLSMALLDLYDLVTVQNDRAGIDEGARVTTVQHQINATPGGFKWLVTLGFSAEGSIAPSTAVPAPPAGVGSVVDEVRGGYDGTLQQIYDNADAAAAAAATAAATGTAAMTAANGKNKVTYSPSGPGATANTAGDIWWQRSGSVIAGQWIGLGGTSWQSATIAGAVIAYLDAGQLTAGSAFINGLVVLTNFTLGDASTNGVIQTYNFAGSSVGVYIDKFGLVAKGGTITGATIVGGVVQTANSSGGYRAVMESLSGAGVFSVYDGATMIGSLRAGSFLGSPTVFLASTSGGSIALGNNYAGVFATNVELAGAVKLSGGDLDMDGNNIGGAFGVTAVGVSAFELSSAGDVNSYDGFFDLALAGGGNTGADINNNGKILRTTSSERFKKDIEPVEFDEACVLAIQGVQHRYIDEENYGTGLYLGVIAEQLMACGMQGFVVFDGDGLPVSVRYDRLVIALLDVLRKHRVELDSIKAQLEAP